jgi:hypothetical protein
MAKQIVIKIEESQDARSFDTSESFFEDELRQARNFISDIIEKNKQESDNQEEHFHQHNTIAILGPRGVGKTSFLLSLKNFINKPPKDDPKEFKDLKDKIIWLPNIDPTMMEKNDLFLVVVVANILEGIRKRFRGDLSQKIRDKLASLGRDFAVLAPSQVHEEQWKDLLGDPSNFAYELLHHAHSGLSLAKNFHEFLQLCLKEMKAEACQCPQAFVQPIDDVDSAIDQGWPILETLRRYLGTSHLITILSGDIRLYQSLVRKQQVDKLKSLIKVRKSIEDDPKIMVQTIELLDQISQITDQYLIKIMPADLRINLVPLSTKIMNAAEKDEELIELKYSSSSDYLSKIYAKFSYDLFNIKPPKPENPTDALKRRSWLPLPLLPLTNRSMVKFLTVIEPWAKNNDKAKKEEAIEKLVQVFNNSLYNGNIQTRDLLDLKSGRHLEWLADYCLGAEKQFPGFWTMESRYDEEELNHRVLLLQAFLFQAWKTRKRKDKEESLLYPNGPMSYIIKVCFPCWIADTHQLVGKSLKNMELKLNVRINKRHIYTVVDGLEYTLDLIQKHRQEQEQKNGRKKPAAEKDRQNDNHYAGVAKIPASINFTAEIKKCFSDPPDEDSRKDVSFIIELFMFQSGIGDASWISLFVGLARITDVLSEGPENVPQLKNLLVLLTEHGLSQIYYSSNSSYSSNSKESTQPEETPGSNQTDHSYQEFEMSEKFLEYLFAWTEKIREIGIIGDEDLVPPLVLSRAFLRFTRNLESIRKSSLQTFGETLELWIAALLNSLLIEEVIFKEGIFDVNLRLEHLRLEHLRRKKNETNIFQKNLENYLCKEDKEDKKDKIKYTLAMLCCPLLLMFLKKTFCSFSKEESKIFGEVRELPIYKKIANALKEEQTNALKEEQTDAPIDNREFYESFLKKRSDALHKLKI